MPVKKPLLNRTDFIIQQLKEELKKKVATEPSKVISDFQLSNLGIEPILNYLDVGKKITSQLLAKNYTQQQVNTYVKNLYNVSYGFSDQNRIGKILGFNQAVQLTEMRNRFSNLLTNYTDTSYVLTQRLKSINQSIENLQATETQYNRKLLTSQLLFQDVKEKAKQQFIQNLKSKEAGTQAFRESWKKLYTKYGIPEKQQLLFNP